MRYNHSEYWLRDKQEASVLVAQRCEPGFSATIPDAWFELLPSARCVPFFRSVAPECLVVGLYCNSFDVCCLLFFESMEH